METMLLFRLTVLLVLCEVVVTCFYPDGSRATDYDYQPCSNTSGSISLKR